MATLTETFKAIADGLRSMLGKTSTTKYTPAQMASTLSGITNRGAVSQTLNTSTTSYTIPAGYHNGSGKVSITTETKTATPSTSSQSITPSSGKVLSKVTVNAISTQTKSATPSTSSQTISPDSGKYLSSVTVNAITPNLSTQTRYQHSSSNTTPLIMADAAFTSTVYDNVSKSNIGDYYQLRFNGSKDKSNNSMSAGWMNSNTLIAVTSQYLRDNLGINSTTVRAGQTIFGVTGANHDATYTYTSGLGDTVDLGAANTYRYVNASNVAAYVTTRVIQSLWAASTIGASGVRKITFPWVSCYLIMAESPIRRSSTYSYDSVIVTTDSSADMNFFMIRTWAANQAIYLENKGTVEKKYWITVNNGTNL